MNFELKPLALEQLSKAKTDALLILVSDAYSDSLTSEPSTAHPLSALIAQSIKAQQLEKKAGKTLVLWNAVGVRANPLILAHTGASEPKDVRQALASAMHQLKSVFATCKHLTVYLPEVQGQIVQTTLQALADTSYVYTTTKPSAKASALLDVTLCVPLLQAKSPEAQHLNQAFKEGVARVKGMELAKEWGNRPANHATPTLLAKAAQTLGKYPRVNVQVLGPKEVAKLGMGSFMSVAQGSEEPLRFIVMQYWGASKSQAPVVLVGKGITFDTGGISLKPGAGMDEMKFDMCGAASVLGVFKSLGELQPTINVIGLVPACENMPSGRAVKPGDVVTSMSGQTIENLNTDAEGRLILCDALTYAERFKPRVVIDIATLTGACIIALGHLRSGMYANHDQLAQDLLDSGERSLDPCWRMPLDEEYAEGLKSNFADTANVADRAAGSVTAAKFLQKFVGQFRWAHLDIAGSAWKSGGASKGATARPVPLLLSYLLNEGQDVHRYDSVSRAKTQHSKSPLKRATKPTRKARA
jgi:leucyl aminopeptidase